jgi:hypothetical protein
VEEGNRRSKEMESNPQVASRLLPQAGAELCRAAPKGRGKRKEEFRTGCRDEAVKVQVTKKASKCSAANQKRGIKARKSEVHRTIDTLRRYAESVGRGDGHLRGSASDLGLTYPTPACALSPTGAHHYVEIALRIYRCKYCWTAIWQPNEIYEAKEFGESIHRLGLQGAYQQKVNGKHKVLEALAMLSALKLVKDSITDTTIVVAAIVNKYNLSEETFEPADIKGWKKSKTIKKAKELTAVHRYANW